MNATMEAVLQSGLGQTRLRPPSDLASEIRRLAAHPDSFARNTGLDLAAFWRGGDAFSAAMLAWSLQILGRAMRKAACGVEDVAAGLEMHVMDALAEARLGQERRAS